MKKTILLFKSFVILLLFIALSAYSQPNAWINELHYDNAGTDVGEFVEIVIDNTGGPYDLNDFTITLYNGNNSTQYDSEIVVNYTPPSTTTGNYSFYAVYISGIQNGAPDGLCLDYQGTLISGQFLSYEGTFTASGGPADGILSTDIGVSESSSTPIGHSLHLAGSGTQYSNFTWQSPDAETPGDLNNGQTFGAAATPTKLVIISVNGGDPAITGIPFGVVVQAQDDTNTPASVTSDVDITLSKASGTGILGGNLIGTMTTGTSSVTITGVTYDTGETGVSITATDDLAGLDPGTSDLFEVIAPIDVSTLSALRAGTLGTVYKLTGEVVLTFQQNFRNQKYIQDATAAILIDDAPNGNFGPGLVTTTYNIGDGITGIIGTLGEFGNMLQFIPATDPGAATAGFTITPQVITLDDLADSFDDYEAELVKILDVSFTDAGLLFENGTVYSISDPSKALGEFRATFFDVDYIGTTIPAAADIVVLPNARTEGNYVTCRTLADFEIDSNEPTQLAITSVNGGFDPYVNADFSVVVQAQDVGGDPAIVTGDVNFTFKAGGTVNFVVGSTTTGTILDGTSQIEVTGVQMAPIGTGVTITAEDDATLNGLSPGTSLPFNVVELVIPDIIITEVMKDPSTVSDNSGEWFEVYNNTSEPVDMLGWVMKDLGSNEHTILASLVVPSFGLAVLGNDDIPATNGGYACDYKYSGFFLGNDDDEIILYLPDGVTEVDRVEWDAGTIWPDPIGSSMVFTGFSDEDNNGGTNWVTSYRREASYTDVGDYGSPGSMGYQQLLSGGFKLDLNAFLEGPYDADLDVMAGNLFVPQDHPFNPALPYYGNLTPKWLYSGSEGYYNFNGNETDWVLVEFRDALSAAAAGSTATVDTRPAMLLNDGSIVCLNGVADLSLNLSVTNNLYIVLWHRNHLGIMSATGLNPVDGTVESYDFSTGSGQVYNGAIDGYKLLETGVWGMVAGDVDAEGNVDASDNADGWVTDAAKAGYLGGDLNLDGQSSNQDKNDVWLLNNGASSQVPN